MTTAPKDPVRQMETGAAEYLRPILDPLGFAFRVLRSGRASGGRYCEAEFRDERRRIELHFRYGLGIVRYHFDDDSASHQSYTDALGVSRTRRYPCTFDDPLEGFRGVAQDFSLLRADFIDGDGQILTVAAAAESRRNAEESRRRQIQHSGDGRKRTQAKEAFRAQEYAVVVQLLGSLAYPEDLTAAERKMLDIAGRRQSARPGGLTSTFAAFFKRRFRRE